jgi:membrane-associated phospholipid phosphatase
LIFKGKHIILCFFLFLEAILFPNKSNARDLKLKVDSARGMHYLKQFPKEVFVNFYKQAIAPFSASKQQWLIGSAVTATSFALIPLDPPLDDKVTNLIYTNNFVGFVSPKITELGGNYVVIPVAVYTLSGIAFKKPKIVETGLMALEATIQAGVWIRLGKTLSGRERPSAAYSSKIIGGKWTGPKWKNIWGGSSVDAFPSGHTGAAFSIASVFAMQYHQTPLVPIIAYASATLVGISRMTEHTHWASDVLLGGAIGYACARQVWKSHHPKITSKNKSLSCLKINPIIFNNFYAANFSLSF